MLNFTHQIVLWNNLLCEFLKRNDNLETYFAALKSAENLEYHIKSLKIAIALKITENDDCNRVSIEEFC